MKSLFAERLYCHCGLPPRRVTDDSITVQLFSQSALTILQSSRLILVVSGPGCSLSVSLSVFLCAGVVTVCQCVPV